jgi:lysophospholipase L1-like esterase
MKALNIQNLFKILSLCFSLAIALVLCEVALKFWFGTSQSQGYYFWPPRLNAIFQPVPEIMPGITGESRFIANSLGIRGDELTPEYKQRILAIGASTTQCASLDQAEMWTQVLQDKLNSQAQGQRAWVGNAGVSGLTSRNHLVAMQHVPFKELKIDTVIMLLGVNDFVKRLSHDTAYDPHYMDKPEAERTLLLETFTGTYSGFPNDPYYKRTALWQLLRKSKRLLAADSGYREDKDGKNFAVWRRHRQQAGEMRERLPDLTTALEEYARNLNRIIDVAHQQSIRIIFVTQPSLWKPGLSPELESLLWLGGVGDFQKEVGKPYYSAAALEKGMIAYNETLLRVCRERQVECFDLAPKLQKDTTVFFDDVHFNENGARLVAEEFSRYLLDRSPFRESFAAHKK